MIEKQIESPASEADIVEAEPVENIDWPEQSSALEAIDGETAHLLTGEEIDELKLRWDMIQIEFVDDPRPTVQQADALVAEVNQRIAQVLSGRRTDLQAHWVEDEDVTTEDLRMALQRYHSFFNRLLDL